MVTQVGNSVAGRSRGQVTSCTVCTVHVEMRSAGFLVEPQNQGRRFDSGLASKPLGRFSSVWASKSMMTVCEWFDLKITRTVFAGLASKPVVTVSDDLASKLVTTISGGLASKPTVTFSSSLISKPTATIFFGLASKPVATVFSSLTSKLVATVSPGLASKPVGGFLVEPQNQGGGGFLGLGFKTGSYSLVIWASKSPRRFLSLYLKTKQVSVCRLRHKIDGGRSAWDTHRDLAACFAWKQV
jgi:hypothetical protein